MTNDLVYLASPYSHPDAWMRELRFKAVARVAGLLYYEQGIKAFCPISHSHPVAMELNPQTVHPHWQGRKKKGPDPNVGAFWLEWDFPYVKACCHMLICQLPGWRESTGVKAEANEFDAVNKIVHHYNPRAHFTNAEWAMLEAGMF